MFVSELHIMPWDIGRLTYEQFEQAIAQFDKTLAEMAKLKAKARG